MRGKCQSWLHLILILSLVISTAIVNLSSVYASPTALYVDPPSIIDTSLVPGTTFTVSVNVLAVTDLFGYEFKLKYKTAVLNATSVTVGPFLKPDIFVVKPPEINDDVGYVWLGVTQGIGEDTGVDGTGTLAIISFTVDSLGGSCLYLCDTDLSDSEGEKIAHEVYDGHFVNDISVHDIAITSVTPSATEALQGQTVDVTVVAKNHGNFPENFTVTAYANATAIGTPENVTDLAPGATTTPLTFAWNTTGVTPGKYTISANATTVPGETDTTDNTCNMTFDFEERIYVDITITVKKFPVAAFNYSPTTPLVNETVTFNASDSTPNGGKIEKYSWQFGDGETATSILPVTTHPYEQYGTYTVILTVRDSEKFAGEYLTGTTSKPITVYLPDVVALVNVTAYPTEVTKPEPVFINVTVANEGVSSETFKTFNFTIYYDGDPIETRTGVTLEPGKNTTLKFTWDTTYVPATPTGTTYKISANASELPYEVNTTNNRFIDGNVTVYKPLGVPSANFTYSPETPIEGEPVSFNASLSTPDGGTIISYEWDFDDGTTEIYVDENLTDTTNHTYAEAGSYTVKLNVTDSEGLWDAVEATVTVYRRDVAIVSVTPDETEVIIGEPVSVNVTAKNEGDLFTETFNVTAYYDGNLFDTHTGVTLEPGKNTTLTFTWDTANVSPGNYTIKANATVVEGETEIDDNEMFFDGTVTLKLSSTISISATPTTITVGESTIVSGAISPVRTNVAVTIQYRSAGESWSELTTVTTDDNSQYSYIWTPTTVGTFELKARWPGDADTWSAESYIQTIIVNKMVSSISITVSPTSVTVGSSTTISGSINPIRAGVTVTIWYRLSEDEAWSTLETVITDDNSQYSHDWTPETAGTYEVKASWPGDANTLQAESDVASLVANALPVASFTYTPSAPIVGDTVTFNASASTDSDGSIDSWDWAFGDGTYGNGEIVTHTYATTGDFTVNLTVTDNDGLTDTTTKSITITKSSSTISITAHPTSITVGESTTLNGSITPMRAGVTVTIWYRLSEDEAWSTLETVITDDNSQYSHDWTPETAGTYEVKANWLGDENTQPSESVTSTITVNEAPTGIPLYLIAAVGAIIIIASCIIAYYLIRKKP